MRTSSEIAEILEDYLNNKKISLRQFSSLNNISHSTIVCWKKKKIYPSIELVGKIAKYMNVSLDWLVFNDNEKRYTISKEELDLFFKFKNNQEEFLDYLKVKELLKNIIT